MVLSVNSYGVERREESGEREGGREEEGRGKDVRVMPSCLHPWMVCIYLDPDCRPLKGGLLAMPPLTSWVPGSDLPSVGESLLFFEVGGTIVGPHPR